MVKMDKSAYFLLVCVFALSLFTSYSEAAGNSTNETDYDEVTTLPPDEIDLAIIELIDAHCSIIFGDCWLMTKVKKPRLSDEKVLASCLRMAQGFMICQDMTKEQAEKGKADAEERDKTFVADIDARLLRIKVTKEERAQKKKEKEEREAQREQERADKKAAAGAGHAGGDF